jgi:hypothetical protein
MGDREWDDHLSIMLVVQNDNLPCFRILIADVKQYLVYEVSSMLTGIIQGSKFFSTIIGDTVFLGCQIKIEARHQNSPSQAHAKICACLQRTH